MRSGVDAAALDPVDHRLDERGRLAGARTGQHQQRAPGVVHDGPLGGVQQRSRAGLGHLVDQSVHGGYWIRGYRRKRADPVRTRRVARRRVENRDDRRSQQRRAEDQVAELGVRVEVDRRAAVPDQRRVREHGHGQHRVGQHQQHPGRPGKAPAVAVAPARTGEQVPGQAEQHQRRAGEAEQEAERVGDEVAAELNSADRIRMPANASARWPVSRRRSPVASDRQHHDDGADQVQHVGVDRQRAVRP